MNRLLGIFAIMGMMAVSGCTSSSSSTDDGLRTGILGANASFLASGRPESADFSAGRGMDRRASYTDLGRDPAAGSGQTGGEPLQITENGSKVTLNFVNADLQEFVRVVFDDVLKESVIVDPNINAKVTIRTSDPVSRQAALSLVRNVLQLNGISLTKSDGVFRVAARGNGVNRGQVGESVRIVPMRYLNADQARGALQPFATNGVEIVANNEGRYLILSGGPGDLDGLVQLLDTLDTDQMQGISFALVPLKDANASSVASELTQMFASGDNGAFKVLAIQRMNAVLLMTRSTASLGRAKEWIQRLDQSGHDARQVRVFPIQNRRASDIAQVLNGLLRGGGDAAQQGEPQAQSASSVSAGDLNTPGRTEPATFGSTSAPVAEAPSLLQGAQIRADTTTNSLVVMAKPENYALIESTIRRLDILPTQVLIEATIAEVGLNDSLRHGVRWFFQQGLHGVSLNDGAGNTISTLAGFNYTFGVPQGQVVVNALEKVTNVEVISSPALTVLDNETATLKVGDQVPIATRAARSVTNPDSPVVNDIELKDTGIILTVTPRVNASGLVLLDIAQEVSDVVPTATSNIDSPTIRQRRITSSIAVQSGAEIVLGGLISSSRQTGKDGIPLLKDIPVLGAAFTSNALQEQRKTELLIIIRPTVIANRVDLQRITEEIKAGMTGINRMRRQSSAF